MDVFKWLNTHEVVTSYTIQDFRRSDTAFYLNIKVMLVDDSELFVREYVDTSHRKYSFHWQTQSGKLIVRWDNAPHFPQIATFPHHKHLSTGEVAESYDISFDEVMTQIQAHLNTT